MNEQEPTRIEVEKGFYKLLENGDEAAIARAIEHTPGYVSQLYSPDNERESTLFRAIKELRAWRRNDLRRGTEALDAFIYFVERGLEPEELCVIEETHRLKKEVDEWESAEMDSASIGARIESIRDIHLQSERAINSHSQYLRRLARKTIANGNGNVR